MNVVHGVSYRTGGVSQEPFDSLNLGLHVGDAPNAVCENRARVAHCFDLDPSCMVCAEQIHGGKVAVVSSEDAGKGAIVFADAIPGVDALVTNTPDLLLSLFFADCVPVFFSDPVTGVVAIAHAGWRGIVAQVIENTLRMMQSHFGTCTDDVQAAIGPHISRDRFAVGEEVATHFTNETIRDLAGKPHIDLSLAVQRRLMESGVPAKNIVVCDECTANNPHRYFSHRGSGGRTGRMGGFIALRPTRLT